METGNPYSPSVVDAESSKTPDESFDLDFGKILKRWEKLRIVYNVVLVVWTVVLLFFANPNMHPMTVLLIPVAAIGVNVLYLLGPVTEAYMTWFGVWHYWMTIGLFLVGLAITGAGAAVALLSG